jgi:hypothetical protein
MAFNGQNYTLRLNLTGFIGSRIIEIDNADMVTERGVFIPIDVNGLYEDSNIHHVLCDAYVNAIPFGNGNKTHNVRLKFKKNHLEKMKSLGYDNPNLGGMWVNQYQTKYQKLSDCCSRVKFNQE